MEPRLSQTQSQKLILAPQLRQFLKLLELPIFELDQKIQQELEENPVLEEVKDETSENITGEDPYSEKNVLHESSEGSDVRDILQTLNSFENARTYDDYTDNFSRDQLSEIQKKRDYQDSILTKLPTLNEYLIWQLGLLDFSPEEKKIAEELIGNIDGDGQLVATTEEIAKETGSSPEKIEEVLTKIQALDPPGVGGRNLREILLNQLKRQEDTALVQTVVRDYLPLLEKKQFDQLARLLKVSPQKMRSIYAKISRLEPKPGRIFYQEKPNFVVPDATVALLPSSEEDGSGLNVEMTRDFIPKLHINPAYRQMIKRKDLDPATKAFLREKIQNGLDLIRAIAQRKSTLAQITDELVKAQTAFFTKGFAYLKPLRLKDVAEKVGVHESTVSRAIQGKYLDTPQGTIPYKSFFSSKLGSANGADESQKSAMERLKRLIATEDKRKPFSDSKLVKLLEQDEIKIARRTVAKYRDLLKILPAHLRKIR